VSPLTLRCTDLVPDDEHCTSCHEDEDFEDCPHPLLGAILKDGREADVCCAAKIWLEDNGLVEKTDLSFLRRR
jgi:hypothetical protein